MVELPSFERSISALVIGASGGIGGAFLRALGDCPQVDRLHAWSRSPLETVPAGVETARVDITDEVQIATHAEAIAVAGPLDLVIVATGVLHLAAGVQPEKSLGALEAGALETVYRINTVGPALLAKHLVPLLPRQGKSVFAALSARVGSIEDNRLGGWYAYRASKAALNMILRNVAIETGRRRKQAVILGLHPGTVDSGLSQPFQGNVPEGKLFTPEFSATSLLQVIDQCRPEQSGRVFAWDGQEIPF